MRPFTNPRYAHLLSEPELYCPDGCRVCKYEAEEADARLIGLAPAVEIPTAGCFIGEFCNNPDCPDFAR